jgi:hypothetical protein
VICILLPFPPEVVLQRLGGKLLDEMIMLYRKKRSSPGLALRYLNDKEVVSQYPHKDPASSHEYITICPVLVVIAVSDSPQPY